VSKVNCQGTEEEKSKEVCPEQGHSLPIWMDGGLRRPSALSLRSGHAAAATFLPIRMAINGASQGRRTIPSRHDGQGRKQSELARSGFYDRVDHCKLDFPTYCVCYQGHPKSQPSFRSLAYLGLCAPIDIRQIDIRS
jgi:hypothetical protein